MQHVRKVLGELKKNGLTANPKKCSLEHRETKYLGFRVGRGKILPLANKVETIQTYNHPQTKKQLRAFLGLVNYYCKFIPWFSELEAPLTKGQEREADAVES